GYTLLMVGPSSAVNATLYDKLDFVFLRDIAPVASLIRQPQIMLANPAVMTKTVPELIADAKANRRIIQDDGRRRFCSRALSRRGTRIGRSARRTGHDLVRRDRRIDRVYQGRQVARARGYDRDAVTGAAGRPDRGRICAWLRGRRLARGRRAPEYARRDC